MRDHCLKKDAGNISYKQIIHSSLLYNAVELYKYMYVDHILHSTVSSIQSSLTRICEYVIMITHHATIAVLWGSFIIHTGKKVLTCLLCPQGERGDIGLTGAAGPQGAPVS